MGLRDRFKKMKNRSASTSGNSTPKVEYYKPGEEPKPKYRGKIDKEHADKLHAFSFSDAWSRRKSTLSDGHGTMSPGGTMAQSRATSFIGSLRKKSVASGSGSDIDGRDVRRKSAAAPPDTATVTENPQDDTDVANAGGLSRPQTANGKPPELANANGAPLEETTTMTTTTTITAANRGLSPSSHDVPFSTDELDKAMTRATIEAPGGVVREGVTAH